MKNKQLDTKDLLMNKKEELIWRVCSGKSSLTMPSTGRL